MRFSVRANELAAAGLGLIVFGSWIACGASPREGSSSLPTGCNSEASARGKATFAQCAICHSQDPAVAHGAGPNLAGLYGRPIGKSDGFRFSPALSNVSGRWTAEKLDAFLANPQTAYPGVRMAFAGIPSTQSRSDLICYLAASQ